MAGGKKRKRQEVTSDDVADYSALKSASFTLRLLPIGKERPSDTKQHVGKKKKEKKKGKRHEKKDTIASKLAPEPEPEPETETEREDIRDEDVASNARQEENAQKTRPKKTQQAPSQSQAKKKASKPPDALVSLRKQSHAQAAQSVPAKTSRFAHRIAALLLAPSSSPSPATAVPPKHRPGTRPPAWYRLNQQPETKTNPTKWQTLPPEILTMIFSQDELLLRVKNKTPVLLIATRPHEALYKIALSIYLRMNLFTTTVKREEDGSPVKSAHARATWGQIRRLKMVIPAPIYKHPRHLSPTTLPSLQNLILTSPSSSALLLLLHPFLYTQPFARLRSLTIELLTPPRPAGFNSLTTSVLVDNTHRQQKSLVLKKVIKRLGPPTRFAAHCSRPKKREVWVWIAKDLVTGFGLAPETSGHIKF